MKNLIISINDKICFLFILLVTLFAFMYAAQFPGPKQLVVTGLCFLFACFVCGFWFVLSGIYSEVKTIRKHFVVTDADRIQLLQQLQMKEANGPVVHDYFPHRDREL